MYYLEHSQNGIWQKHDKHEAITFDSPVKARAYAKRMTDNQSYYGYHIPTGSYWQVLRKVGGEFESVGNKIHVK